MTENFVQVLVTVFQPIQQLEILKNINLEQEREILVKNINETKSKVSEERSIKRLKLIDSFIKTGNKP